MLLWFEVLGYTVLLERESSFRILTERETESEVILRDRLAQSLRKINPHVSELALQKAIKKLYFYDCKNQINSQTETLQKYLTQGNVKPVGFDKLLK